jgi:hypothetical protein
MRLQRFELTNRMAVEGIAEVFNVFSRELRIVYDERIRRVGSGGELNLAMRRARRRLVSDLS